MKSFTLRYENSHHNMYIMYNSCKIEDQLLKYMLESLIFFFPIGRLYLSISVLNNVENVRIIGT